MSVFQLREIQVGKLERKIEVYFVIGLGIVERRFGELGRIRSLVYWFEGFLGLIEDLQRVMKVNKNVLRIFFNQKSIGGFVVVVVLLLRLCF